MNLVSFRYVTAFIWFIFLKIVKKKLLDCGCDETGDENQNLDDTITQRGGRTKSNFDLSRYFILFLVILFTLFFYRFTYLFFINLKNNY